MLFRSEHLVCLCRAVILFTNVGMTARIDALEVEIDRAYAEYDGDNPAVEAVFRYQQAVARLMRENDLFGALEPVLAAVEARSPRGLRARNTGDRPIQIGSHYHFFEANRALEFDRAQAFGMHLDIPAGTAVRFEPGEEKEVTLVLFGEIGRAHV